MSMVFSANTSPFGGREGQYVTARQIRARLEKEALHNVAIRLEILGNDAFNILGRGELQLAILIETMRREGYELSVAKPEIVTREIDGTSNTSPWRSSRSTAPRSTSGVVTQKLGTRKGKMSEMHNPDTAACGFRSGSRRGVSSASGPSSSPTPAAPASSTTSSTAGPPWQGPIAGRATGALVSDRPGKTTTYALYHLEPRGTLFMGPGPRSTRA
jgi:GTP-binding protein